MTISETIKVLHDLQKYRRDKYVNTLDNRKIAKLKRKIIAIPKFARIEDYIMAMKNFIRKMGKGKHKTIHLVLKRKWWDVIASGEKKEEYREICPYWANRLLNDHPLPVKGYWDSVIPKHIEAREKHPYFKTLVWNYGTRGYEQVCFHLGYTNETMAYVIDGIDERTGREEWGAEPGKDYFVISLGERIDIIDTYHEQVTLEAAKHKDMGWNVYLGETLTCDESGEPIKIERIE